MVVVTEQPGEPETKSQAGPHTSDSQNETAVSMAPSKRADTHAITISDAQNGAVVNGTAAAETAKPHPIPSSKHENGPVPGSQGGMGSQGQQAKGLSGHEADSMELRKIRQASQRRPGASHMTLPFEPMVLTFQDVRYIVPNQAVGHCELVACLICKSKHPCAMQGPDIKSGNSCWPAMMSTSCTTCIVV